MQLLGGGTNQSNQSNYGVLDLLCMFPFAIYFLLEKKPTFGIIPVRTGKEMMSRHLSQTYIIKWAGSSETAPRWLCPKKKTKKLLAFVGFVGFFGGGCFHHTSHTHIRLPVSTYLHIYLYLPPHQNIPTKSLATILCLSLHAQPKSVKSVQSQMF